MASGEAEVGVDVIEALLLDEEAELTAEAAAALTDVFKRFGTAKKKAEISERIEGHRHRKSA